jgi:hypothetical protein
MKYDRISMKNNPSLEKITYKVSSELGILHKVNTGDET